MFPTGLTVLHGQWTPMMPEDCEGSRGAIVIRQDWSHRPVFAILRLFTVDLIEMYSLLIELYNWTL